MSEDTMKLHAEAWRQTDDVSRRIQNVLLEARELADYVRNRAHKHITEVKLIEAVDALEEARRSLAK